MPRYSLFLLGTIALAPGTALAAPIYTFTDLSTLGGHDSYSFDINASGQVTGYSSLAEIAGNTVSHAFLWDPQSGMHDLGTLPGGDYSYGQGINASGQVTGYSTGDPGGAFLWDPQSSMHHPGTLDGAPEGINASGQVTGDINSAGSGHAFLTTHAFLWDPQSGMHDLGTLPGGDYSYGSDINASGQVAGSSETADGTHAFLWDPQSGMHDLGILPGGDESVGNDINASGQVTGYGHTATGLDHAFLWNGSSMLDLNDLIPSGLGWTLNDGGAINDAGQIAGSGSIGGQSHAFVLTPIAAAEVPEPGTLALIGAGVIGLGLLRHRKGRTNTATQAPAA